MLEKLLNRSESNVSVDALVDALTQLEISMPGAATRNPRAALKKTITFLKGHSGESVEALAAALAERKAKAPPNKSAPALRKAVVDEHLSELSKAEKSPTDFDQALSALKNDKRIRMAELAEIIKGYTGSTAKPKTKASGYSEIDHAFDQRWKLRSR